MMVITRRLEELQTELTGARVAADFRARHGLYTEAQLWAEYATRLQADWLTEAKSAVVEPVR